MIQNQIWHEVLFEKDGNWHSYIQNNIVDKYFPNAYGFSDALFAPGE